MEKGNSPPTGTAEATTAALEALLKQGEKAGGVLYFESRPWPKILRVEHRTCHVQFFDADYIYDVAIEAQVQQGRLGVLAKASRQRHGSAALQLNTDETWLDDKGCVTTWAKGGVFSATETAHINYALQHLFEDKAGET